jgi:hypothetical protein
VTFFKKKSAFVLIECARLSLMGKPSSWPPTVSHMRPGSFGGLKFNKLFCKIMYHLNIFLNMQLGILFIFRHLIIKFIFLEQNIEYMKKVKKPRTHMTYLAGLHVIGVKGLFYADWLGAGPLRLLLANS